MDGKSGRRRATTGAALPVKVGARGPHPQLRAQLRHRGSLRWRRRRQLPLQAAGPRSPAEEVRNSPRLSLTDIGQSRPWLAEVGLARHEKARFLPRNYRTAASKKTTE